MKSKYLTRQQRMLRKSFVDKRTHPLSCALRINKGRVPESTNSMTYSFATGDRVQAHDLIGTVSAVEPYTKQVHVLFDGHRQPKMCSPTVLKKL